MKLFPTCQVTVRFRGLKHHTLHPSPYTSYPQPFTLLPTPYTLHCLGALSSERGMCSKIMQIVWKIRQMQAGDLTPPAWPAARLERGGPFKHRTPHTSHSQVRPLSTRAAAPLAQHSTGPGPYRGISLISNRLPLGPYSRSMPRAVWWS